MRARELCALVVSGAVDGLPHRVKGRVDSQSRVRKIIDLDLWEISIVTFPLLAGARVRLAKGASVSFPPKQTTRGRAPTGSGRAGAALHA